MSAADPRSRSAGTITYVGPDRYRLGVRWWRGGAPREFTILGTRAEAEAELARIVAHRDSGGAAPPDGRGRKITQARAKVPAEVLAPDDIAGLLAVNLATIREAAQRAADAAWAASWCVTTDEDRQALDEALAALTAVAS